MEPVEAMEVEEECGDLLGDYNSNLLMDKSSSVWRRSREREEGVGAEESDKTVAYWRRSRGSSCGSSAASPDTEEFESIERRLHSELEQKLVERERRVSDMSDRKVSDLEEPVSLQLVEKRQLRTFSRADEYLYAMKEDLAEWLNLLYPNINIDAENFMETLQTGEHLLRHANSVRHETLDLIMKIEAGELKRKLPSFSVPEADLPIRENVVPGTWFARDNVYNFIKFCRLLQVMEVVMFETEDLVSSKNEKHVVLTLLEVARRGAKIGMLAPMLVQFEQEIDQEIAREEKERKKIEKEERERERQIKEEEKAKKRQAAKIAAEKQATKIAAEREAAREAARESAREKQEAAREAARQAAIDAAAAANDDIDLFPSLAVEVEDDTGLGDVEDEDDYPNDIDIDNVGEEGLDDLEGVDDLEEDEAEEEEEEEEEEEVEEEMEGYAYPIGPMPQIVSNDLRSLDEMVRDLVSECQCPSQFPMHRISEGRYKIGDTNVMIFVRILRSHVMVRVGGGWDTLQNYLDKHDPCRCRRGHRSTLGAHMNVRTSRSPMAVGVTYDRSESPGTPTRRSSTSVMSQPPRRGSSYCSPSHYPAPPHSPTDKSRSFSRQWDSPRGSLSGTLPRDSSRGLNSPRGSIGGTLPRSRSPSAPFVVGSQSPASTRRMLGRTPPAASAKVSKSNGPSPLLRDGLREGLDAGMSRLRNPYETQQAPKDEAGFGTRSDSSLSLGKDGRRTDPLTLCDSGSEVSDEGYKSSHGNVSKTEDNQSNTTEDSAKNAESPVPERPESSLTVGSECSSTISTDDGRTNSPVDEEQGSSSPTLTSDLGNLAPKCLDETQETVLDTLAPDTKESSAQLSPTTKSRLANLLNKIPKLGRSKKNGSDTTTSPDSSDKEASPTHSAKPTNNKTSHAYHRNNSSGPLSRNNSSTTFSRHNSSGTFSRNNSSAALYRENNNKSNTNNTTSPMRTLPRTPSGYGTLKTSVDTPSRNTVTRSRSMSSDNGMAGLSRQGSYRAPRGTSRYMQAAQAYASRNKGNTSTWSSSATRTPSRPSLATDTFQPPPKRHSRTASASPGVHRRRFISSSNQTSPTDPHGPCPQVTSTHSTPSKRPQNRKISPINKDPLLLGEFESDEHILKRMEEILFTYKSKVEDKLAAEGKELPKDIFEDFTSHWVNSSPHRAKSMDSLDSTDKSTQDTSPNSKKTRKLPTPRQDYREGQKLTKIPLPTFYKSPIPSETHL